MLMQRFAPVLLSLGLYSFIPAYAAPLLPLTTAQKSSLGIVTAPVTAAASTVQTFTARVTLPPASLAVIAAGGAGLVTRIHAQTGDTVKRGAPLAVLSMAGLAEAQNVATQARLRVKLATSNAQRDENLFAEGLIAESRLRATQSEALAARASLGAAQAMLGLFGQGRVRGAELTLTSPLAGVVLESMIEPGARVDAGMALMKIADLSRLALEIPLSPTQAAGVAVGQTVSLADGTRGRITALLPQLNAAQNVLARAVLDRAATLLRPGQSVTVSIAAPRSARGLHIPASALVWVGKSPYVFVETARGYTPTPITLLNQNMADAEVSGLVAGSRVAVKGVAALKAQWAGE
jgi:cobalt-zinc-cadmium efflux system membrane fusion protein